MFFEIFKNLLFGLVYITLFIYNGKYLKYHYNMLYILCFFQKFQVLTSIYNVLQKFLKRISIILLTLVYEAVLLRKALKGGVLN